MKEVQDTSSETFRQIMANGLSYKIPKFQRDYSWRDEQWDDLWEDIQALYLSNEKEQTVHYMGYLVLQTHDSRNFRVIDGQQRLTTISLLILSLLKRLQKLTKEGQKKDENRRRIDTLRNSYIGSLDPVTLIPSNKLTLNRNNDAYYRSYLATLEDPLSHGINASERLMRNCFWWFYKKLESIEESGNGDRGENLARFIDSLVDRLFFTVIKVSDEVNAFRVFETLNARGVQLPSADLLKNWLFSVVDSGNPHIREIEELEQMWQRIIDKLSSQKVPQFLQQFWNSGNKTVRKKNLFKAIRDKIKSKGEAFQLMRNMDRTVDIYMALQDPQDELWRERQDIAKWIDNLKLFRVKQPISLLLAAYEHLKPQEFETVVKACSIISFRYNVICNYNANEQERVYNSSALKIKKQGTFDLNWLQGVYPNDETFETEFTNKSFLQTVNNMKIVRYILAEIEKNKYGSDINLKSDTYTTEHIIPQNPEGSWEKLSDDEIERCVNRLGNLVILEKGLNKDAGRSNFETKREAYKKSNLRLTQAISERYESWNESKIADRQKAMAKTAKSIWSLSFPAKFLK